VIRSAAAALTHSQAIVDLRGTTLRSRVRDAVTTAGFSRFRRATETPFNLVDEARP
jgi:hypothetical protein